MANSTKKHSSNKKSPSKNTSPKAVYKRKNSKRVPLPLVIFIIGAILLSISIGYHIEQTLNLTFYHQQLAPTQVERTSRPVEIIIDKVNIDLPIIETDITNNTWQIADNGISHLSLSSRPAENGTIILYGHNTTDRFGPIRWLQKGEKITVVTADNKKYDYKILKTATVDPSDTTILTSEKGPTLILYTCTGFADLKRYVLIAKPL